MFNMKYGPNAGLLSRPMAAALQQAPQVPQMQEGKTPARRPRGLFGRAQDWLSQTGDDGISRADRIGTIGALLRDNPAVGQNALAMQQDRIVQQQALAREQQERQGAQNTAQKAQLQEREQLNALADSYGLQGAERARFLLSPPDVREEYLNRQMNPEQPDMPSSYEEFQLAQQNPAYAQHLQANPRGNRVDVRVGDEGERFGAIPPGYMMTQQDGGWQMVPVPGSPSAIASQAKGDQRELFGGVVLEDIGRAADLIVNGEFGTTGRLSGIRAIDPESDAGTLAGLYGTIRANVGFDRLQAMRETSPTGGAVGALSDSERRAFESTLGDLEQSRRPEVQLYNLGRLQNLYLNMIYGTPAQLQDAVDAGRLDLATAQQYMQRTPPDVFVQQMLGGAQSDQAAPKGPAAGAQARGVPQPGDVVEGVPPGVDPELYAHMTPEERALWQQ